MIIGRNPIARLFVSTIVMALLLIMTIGCGEESTPQYETTIPKDSGTDSVTRADLSQGASQGEELFNANCSVCHGVNAAGTDQGPPLIDRIYHPGHHPDFSIRNAVSKGVQQHHWVFGNMAPIASVSPNEVEKIICYIRETQLANGIFEADDYSTTC